MNIWTKITQPKRCDDKCPYWDKYRKSLWIKCPQGWWFCYFGEQPEMITYFRKWIHKTINQIDYKIKVIIKIIKKNGKNRFKIR